MLPCMIGLEGPALTPAEEQAIRLFQPAGFVLFSRNIESVRQTRELTDSLRKLSRHVPVIAIDQEGGRVVRTGALGLHLPSAHALATGGNAGDIADMARLTAWMLRILGINTNFAPVLDISEGDAANSLQGRCWGSTADDVVQYAGIYLANLVHHGIAGCGKHFPGMGMAGVDPHHSLPVIDSTYENMMEKELVPFMALAKRLPSVMVAHVLIPCADPEYPASLSHEIVTGWLRNRMGYGKLVFTDDLCMGAVSANMGLAQAAATSIRAGCDLPLLCHDPLPHLDHLAGLLPPEHGYERSDIEKRLAQFDKKFSSPIDHSGSVWARLERELDELNSRYPACGNAPAPSPVQEY